jgi:hypothetical protein
MVSKLKWVVFLALAGCAGKAVPIVEDPDATVDRRVGSSIVCPIPGTCIGGPGTPGTKVLTTLDGGQAVWATSSGGGSTYYGVDGGGVGVVEAGVAIKALFCDAGGALVRGSGAGAYYECVPQGLGVNSVSATSPLTITGPAYSPNVSITPGTDYTSLGVNGSGAMAFQAVNLGQSAAVTGSLPLANQAGPTGTGLAGVTSGAFSAAAIAGTHSQIVDYNSSSVPVAVTVSGDTTIADGVTTTASLQSGEVTCGATTGTLTAASTATAPGLAQASESTTQTPTFMAITPQVSAHSTTQDSSGLDIDLSAPLGSGVDGYTVFRRNGVAQVTMGAYPGGVGEGIWFGIDRSAVTTLNHSFLQYASSVYLNAQSGGTVYFEIGGGGGIQEELNTSSAGFVGSLSVGALSATYAGGTNSEFFASGTAPSGSATGGALINSTNGGLFGYGMQATSLPITTETLVAPYSGTLNTTAMTGGGTTAQAITVKHGLPVCSFAAATSGTCAAQLDAIPDSIAESVKARIVCTVMTANTGETVGEAVQAESTALVSLPHGTSTVTVLGTPVYSLAAMGSSGLTATAVWTASGTSPTVTWTLGSANLVGANKCSVFSGEWLN